MSKKYNDESEIRALVESFETGTIAEADWRHAEHLAVALFYLSHHDFETALERMRAGIFNLLKAFGVDTTRETPYHETLTVFWMRTVEDFRRSKNGAAIGEICGELVETFDKNHPLKFYSAELLYTKQARREFVAPDLKRG